VTGAFGHLRISRIDQSTAIVAGSAKNSERENFPLKSKAENLTDRQSGFDRRWNEFARKNQRDTMH
jgi:hypothetical protein